MESIGVYKDRAVESLEGNWLKGVLASLVCWVIMGVIPMCSHYVTAHIVWYLLALPLVWGNVVFFLGIARKEEVAYEQLFEGFSKDYVRIVLTLLLVYIYTFLWSLLLIVPGIIKTYSYSMTCFILKDEPGMKSDDAIKKSMDMMHGHKMRLFLLDLSMIGWVILSVLTLGIGFLLLNPYNSTAHAHFYEDLKKRVEVS